MQEEVILEYTQELREGGYPLSVREEIIKSATTGFQRLWEAQCRGEANINRPGHSTRVKRRAGRLNPHNWFKKKGQNPKSTAKPSIQKKHKEPRQKQALIEAVMFCPYTPGSALKKELTKAEEFLTRNQTVGRVRFVERAGPKLRNLLTNKAPWTKQWCNRPDCQPCITAPGSCRALNIVYQINCQTCASGGQKALYFGESSRAWWDRARDHSQALKSKNKEYAIVKHWIQKHGDMEDPPASSSSS